MSNFEERYGSGATGGSASPPAVTPNYGSSGPLPTSKENEPVQATRCATGIRFIRTINGILNFVVIVSKNRSMRTITRAVLFTSRSLWFVF